MNSYEEYVLKISTWDGKRYQWEDEGREWLLPSRHFSPPPHHHPKCKMHLFQNAMFTPFQDKYLAIIVTFTKHEAGDYRPA